MSKSLRLGLSAVGLAVVVAVILLVTGLVDLTGSGPEPTRTTGTPGVGGAPTTDEHVLAALRDIEARLANTPIRVDVGSNSFNLVPASIGFDLDEESTVAAALATDSADSVMAAISAWNDGGAPPANLSMVGTVDQAALSRMFDHYDSVLDGPFDGGIVVEGTTPFARYPSPGLVVDRTTATDRMMAALLRLPRPEGVALDTVQRLPVLAAEAVDKALGEAFLLLGGPVTLTRTDPDATLFLSVEHLARALVTRVATDPSPRLVVTFDPIVFDEYLQPLRTGFEAPPVDARLLIDDDDNITILPGFPGARIDTDLVVEAVRQAARRETRTAVLPLDAGVQPDIRADDLRNVTGKISEFTTNHPCCQPRVNNIHLFADSMDGRMLLPGEVMSLNDTVGERTLDRGFVPAPTIIRGEITDTVGGGVSQFATTFYNAVFWAGLEIIEHKPHSYYFSRYPEGIEATISWREPDLVFRNDTAFPVVIKTAYTRTSITVKLFGDNSDREVSAWVSERSDWTEFPTDYLPNPEVMPWDGELEVRKGANGWSVRVTRQLAFNDGSVTSQAWNVRYRALPRQVEVHPCLLPEDSEEYTGEECPPTPEGVTLPTQPDPDTDKDGTEGAEEHTEDGTDG